MKKTTFALVFSCIAFLLACNGSSGENDSDESLVPASISLSIVNSVGKTQHSFDINEVATLKALVLDEDGNTVSNEVVNFSAGIGELSLDSKLTDSDGYATISLTNASSVLGASNATASVSSFSDSVGYEFIVSDINELASSISTQLLLNGSDVSQFSYDQVINITTIVTDTDGSAVNGATVSFTADVGVLSESSATSINGIAQVTLSSSVDAIGSGIVTATLISESENIVNRISYEILAADPTNSDIRLGYFNESNEFVEGVIALEIEGDTISAGGSVGLSVAIVDSTDTLVSSPTSVSFTSNCVANGNASIDETALSIKGKAGATYEDIKCAGTSGTEDVIVASITTDNVTTTATATLNITGEKLGSIEFVSAEPDSIVLKGTGGQETSTLTFLVKSTLGNTLSQQAVDFSLNTEVGGITLSRRSGFTNSQGLVTTQVIAGTVPTAVRVTAKAAITVNDVEETVQTQSDLLSVNTGLPEQRSFTIAANPLNPEASVNGTTSEISVWLADNFNNPVPDGTTVNFTTEGGVIEPSCTTTNGHCSVTWTASEPRVDDHRVTILATALGHETFFDTNGNNTFDGDDGSAIVDQFVSSGFGRHNAEISGFIDMSEAWRDDNENYSYDAGEAFLDFNNDGVFSTEDSTFNGPQCDGSQCAASNSIHVRKSFTLIMSSSSASYVLTQNDTTYEDSLADISLDLPDVPDATIVEYHFDFADSAGQALAEGTTITITTSVGTLSGVTNFTVDNTNLTGSISFFLENPAEGDAESGLLTFTITSPSGVVTTLNKLINIL